MKKTFSLISILRESGDDYDYDYEYYDKEDELKSDMFYDFLYRNTPDFTKHVPWTLIPFPRLKKIWNDYMAYGSIRDTRGLEMIEDIMINNTTKVNIFTNLAGHTQWGDEEAFKENIGYWTNEQVNCLLPQKQEDKTQLEIPFNNPAKGYVQKEPSPKVEPCDVTIHPFAQNFFNENHDEEMAREQFHELLYNEMKDRFFDYYQNDPEEKFGSFISDYGLEPLMKLLAELLRATTPEEKLLIIDRMLNVVHQRSDIAEWFVEGGSSSLSQLSGNPSEALNEEIKRIFEIIESFNATTTDNRYKNLIEFIGKPSYYGYLTYLHTTNSVDNANSICKNGLKFEEFRSTTDEVNDEISLIYKLLIRKQYGNFTIIIQINENIRDMSYESISQPSDEETFILPPQYIRGYYNRETKEIVENPLFKN